MTVVIYLSAADILRGEMAELLHGVINGKATLPYRSEHFFQFILIHKIVPAALN